MLKMDIEKGTKLDHHRNRKSSKRLVGGRKLEYAYVSQILNCI